MEGREGGAVGGGALGQGASEGNKVSTQNDPELAKGEGHPGGEAWELSVLESTTEGEGRLWILCSSCHTTGTQGPEWACTKEWPPGTFWQSVSRCLWQPISTSFCSASLNRDGGLTGKLQMWKWLGVDGGPRGGHGVRVFFQNYGGVRACMCVCVCRGLCARGNRDRVWQKGLALCPVT